MRVLVLNCGSSSVKYQLVETSRERIASADDLLLARGIEKWRNGMGVRGFQGIGLKAEPRPERSRFADDNDD